MKTIVITGGTDGIGRGLADTYLRRGDRVIVVGTSRAKGEGFLAAASGLHARDRAEFFPADLSSVQGNLRLVTELSTRIDALDVLVLGARYHRSTRVLTSDGFESNFALFYLSRYLLSHGLAGLLSRADRPVVLNFGAAGLTGPVRWDDLQLERDYHGVAAMGHAGRLNDLLALDVSDRYPESGISYVINHPGVVVTSFAGEYDDAPITAQQVDQLRATGKSVETAVRHILPFLDPTERVPLTAVHEGAAVPLDPEAWSLRDARSLHEITRELLDGHRTGGTG